MSNADSIYVTGLPIDVSEQELLQFFGQIGSVKIDARSGIPAVWLYKDAETGTPRGDAVVTFNDPYSASSAIQCCHQRPMRGSIMHVNLTSSADLNTYAQSAYQGVTQTQQQGALYYDASSQMYAPTTATNDVQTHQPAETVTKQSDNPQPTTQGTAQSSAGAKGRGKKVTAAPQGPARLFGPDDWPCPSCGNTNWARRQRCNLCGAPKPGTLDMRREGQGGGFKELDEEEIEDARRRRRALEEADDGELYDDYGRIKKKYRNIVDKATREQAALARLRGSYDPSPSGQELAKWFKKEDVDTENKEQEEVAETKASEAISPSSAQEHEREERGEDRTVTREKDDHRSREAEARRDDRRRSISPRYSRSSRRQRSPHRDAYRSRRVHKRTDKRDDRLRYRR